MNSQSIQVVKRRMHHKRRDASGANPPTPPALVAATYTTDTGQMVHLTFDRAVDISAIDVTQIVVDDADNLELKFQGRSPAALESPNTVRVLLQDIGDATGTGTTLDAGAANGIVASDDGVEWAGVEALPLPFP